jgi:hypothetical protein
LFSPIVLSPIFESQPVMYMPHIIEHLIYYICPPNLFSPAWIKQLVVLSE